MAKQKTHSSSKKRFKVTGTGKVKRAQAYKKHILNRRLQNVNVNYVKLLQLVSQIRKGSNV